jgi:hypothetical protein
MRAIANEVVTDYNVRQIGLDRPEMDSSVVGGTAESLTEACFIWPCCQRPIQAHPMAREGINRVP